MIEVPACPNADRAVGGEAWPAGSGPIDVHTHWFEFGVRTAAAEAGLRSLERAGFRAVVVYPLAGLGLPKDRVPLLLAPMVHDNIGLDGGAAWVSDDAESCVRFLDAWNSGPHRIELIPFLDIRAWDTETDLRPWLAAGMRGLKNILLLEEDSQHMGNDSLRRVRGLSREEYLEQHRRTFALAEEFQVPLVCHADLRYHGEFMRECLRTHPRARVDIPHFGFSRRIIAEFFEEFPLLYSDIANLAPHIRANPSSYTAFFEQFSDRVMLGSDSHAGASFTEATAYPALIRGLKLSTTTAGAILSGNPRRFLGLD